MSKTPQEELVEPVASELVSFLKQGEINPKFVEKQLQYKGVDRLQDLKSILRIHFVLSERVVDFLERLPERIRRIKTESKKQTARRRGEVRGKVNWSRTISQQRSQQDRSIFIYQNPSKNYDLPENLVLKKLLSIIFTVLDTDLKKPLDKNYSWLKGLQGKQDLVGTLENIVRRNVHVNRISDPEEYTISERDLSKAENSRKGLYKEAAKRLVEYNKLMEGDYEEDDLEELLNETLILPKDAATLFELYAVFKLIRKVGKGFKINKIEEGADEIASFEGTNSKTIVYHDSTGERLSFFEDLDKLRHKEANIEFLEKYRKARLEHTRLIGNLIGRESETLYSGRPDILIEQYEDDSLKKIWIGEVKYTDLKQTFSRGLKELVEYLYFAHSEDGYLTDSGDEVEMKGILVVDDMEYINKDELDENKVKSSDSFEIEVYDTDSLKGTAKNQ